MDLSSSPILQHSNTASLQFYSFLFVPFEHDAVDYSAVRSVILNEVNDLSSENSGSWTLHFLRSLAFARDDRDYFLSFHFNTTPCITPPISRSFSLWCTMSARVKPVMA